MIKKKPWSSTVACMLVQNVRSEGETLIARRGASKKGKLAPPEIAARLAQELRGVAGYPEIKRLEPVDIASICAKVGLTVEYQPLSVDALLQETESGYLATVNSTQRPSRQRMSLAHEIGHLMLYQATGLRESFGHILPDQRQSDESQEIEKLCDCFAAELVLPSEVWEKQLKTGGYSLTTLRKLMDCYDITVGTAAKRAAEVGTMEFAVIAWTPIYKDDSLVELKPVKSWCKNSAGESVEPFSIPNREEFCLPGSPLYAFKQKSETFGKISLGGVEGSYMAHSDVIDSKYIATVIIPKHYGWGMMFGHSWPKSLSNAAG
jgi:Zn-dependent peptidase ImmA (M78 family)